MQLILAISHSIIIVHHIVTLITCMLGGILTLMLEVEYDTSPGLLLSGIPMARIDVIVGRI